MVIQNKQEGSKGMFFVENEGEIQAELIYSMPSTNKMIIEHTEVGEALRGQNVGFKLVNAAVEYARHYNLKISVLCPFAKKVFDKRPDFADVLV
jgi:predicted GNAT family acetyltransferase